MWLMVHQKIPNTIQPRLETFISQIFKGSFMYTHIYIYEFPYMWLMVHQKIPNTIQPRLETFISQIFKGSFY